MLDRNNTLSIVDQQKFSLIEQGFVYNPMHESFQKIKSFNEKSKTFHNVVFAKNEQSEEYDELWISNQVHNLDDDTRYYLYILFLGKLPKTVEYFRSLTHSVISTNKIVDNEMVRYLLQILEKHNYKLIDKKTHNVELEGKVKTFFEFKLEKTIGHYSITAKLELPTNKINFNLINYENESRTTILDIYVPPTILELNIIFNHIPLILFTY